ncbi:hypothetical protein GW17_00038741 [Ensete ventricosum]|nr:hypothetical protein GW17_00038741 [Ensete ventricosum]
MRSRSAVKRIKSRIEAIGKKKQAVLRLLKNDVADLLAAGRDSDAFGRVSGGSHTDNLADCGMHCAYRLVCTVHTAWYGSRIGTDNISVHQYGPEQPKRAVLPHSGNDATPPMLTKNSKEETSSKKNHEPTPKTVARTQVQEPKNNYLISAFTTDQLHATVVKTRKVNAKGIENVEPYQTNAVVPPYGNLKIKQKGSCGNDDLTYVPQQMTTEVQEQLDQRGPEKQVGIMNYWNDKPTVGPPYTKSNGNSNKRQIREKSANGLEYDRSQRHEEWSDPPYTKSNGNSNKSQIGEKSANGLEYDRSQRHEEWSDPNAKERLPIRPVKNKGTAINMIPPYVKPKVNDISANGDRMIQRLSSAGGNKPCHASDNYKDQVPSDKRIMSNSLQRNSQKPAVMETIDKSIYDEKLTSQTPRSQRRHRSRRSVGANGEYFDEGKNITRHPRAPIDDEMDNAIVYGKLMSQTSPWHGRNGGKHNVTTYDEEEYEKEMVMDRLLIHYSKKGTSNERIKTRRRTRILSMDHVVDSDRSMDNQGSGKFQPGPGVSAAHPPERAVSLPPESVRSAEALKLPTQATLMQSDLLSPSGRRVHPRLPEYDELAARFAALKKD